MSVCSYWENFPVLYRLLEDEPRDELDGGVARFANEIVWDVPGFVFLILARRAFF